MSTLDGFAHDRFLVDQLIRPIANLYRVTPLAAGETPAGPPVAYVRQKKLAIKERIGFFADEAETQEAFHIQARTWLDTGGSKYDVVGVWMSKWARSARVRRVSSHAITSASFRIRSARSVMSSRFPMGVATTNSVPVT